MPDSPHDERGAPASPPFTAEDLKARIEAVLDGWLACAAPDWWPDTGAVAGRILAALGAERVECRFCGMADDGPCEDGREHAYLWLLDGPA